VGKHSLLSPFLRLRGLSRLTTDTAGFQSKQSPLCTPISFRTIHRSLTTSFPVPKKRKEGRKEERAKKKENRKKY
jgi:hypothetical protein